MIDFNPQQLQTYLVGGTQDTNHQANFLLTKVECALASGITAFQYREKGTSTLSDLERLTLAKQLRSLCHQYHVPFIIDDDWKLALACQADGLHVGQGDTPIQTILTQTAGQCFVGYSCQTLAHLQLANQLPLAYVGLGPVFTTNSKADATKPLGLPQLTTLNATSHHPSVAIGGITAANYPAVMQTGVAGVAVISAVLAADDLARAVDALKPH